MVEICLNFTYCQYEHTLRATFFIEGIQSVAVQKCLIIVFLHDSYYNVCICVLYVSSIKVSDCEI